MYRTRDDRGEGLVAGESLESRWKVGALDIDTTRRQPGSFVYLIYFSTFYFAIHLEHAEGSTAVTSAHLYNQVWFLFFSFVHIFCVDLDQSVPPM